MRVKHDDKNESSEDEDTKFKSYITRQFKKFIKNVNVKASDKDCKHLDFLSSNPKTKATENSKMLDKAITFLLGQSAMDVKDMDT